MSNALSATVIAIICYAIFTYFYMRLMDARTQLLANVEDVTSLYIIPRFKQDVKSLSAEMQALVSEVKNAAEILNRTQNRYLEAGGDAVGPSMTINGNTPYTNKGGSPWEPQCACPRVRHL